MTNKRGGEEREFSRIPMKMTVKVAAQGKETISSDQVKNVSMNGLFIFTDHSFPEETECEVTMLVGDPGAQLKIVVKGKVVRAADSGFAIGFVEMGTESYGHLQNLVLYNSNNTRQVEQEFESHLGLKRRQQP